MDLQHISDIERAAHSGRGEVFRLGMGVIFLVGVMFYAALNGTGEGSMTLVMAAMVGGGVLVGLAEFIRDVMVVTGFLEFFDDYATLQEGLAAMTGD